MAALQDILSHLFGQPVPDGAGLNAGQWWKQLPAHVAEGAGDTVGMGPGYWQACRQADRASFGFMAGYQFALRALLQRNGLEEFVAGAGDAILSFCWTEQGGGHPRAIETRLQEGPGGWVLHGDKRFCSAVDSSGWLLIAARTGLDDEGRPRLRIAAVPGHAQGVTFGEPLQVAMVPEVVHSAVHCDNVTVADDRVLPGDGFLDYSKCFRDLEDLYVMTALVAVFLRVTAAKQDPARLAEGVSMLQDAASLAAREQAGSPAFQVGLAALLQRHEQWWRGQDWTVLAADLAESWQRDLALRMVAGKARATRAERADAWLRSVLVS